MGKKKYKGGVPVQQGTAAIAPKVPEARRIPDLPGRPVQIPCPPDMRAQCPSLRIWRVGELTVMKSLTHGGERDGTLSMRVFHESRFPTMKEMIMCRAHFLPPDKMFAMIFPAFGLNEDIMPNACQLGEVRAVDQAQFATSAESVPINDRILKDILKR